MKFDEILQMVEVTEEDRQHFIVDCSSWGRYCTAISFYNKMQILKLIKYLLDERPSGKQLLARAVMRFNRLNALYVHHLT